MDEYLLSLEAPDRNAFEHVRRLALEVAPEAEAGTSYGMAALIYRKKPLLGFRAARGHLSIFPFSPGVVDAVRERLDGFELSKGTVRFKAAAPLPDDVVREMVRHRMAEIDATP